MDAFVIETVVDIDTQFEALQQNLTKLKTNLSDMQQQLRTLEKSVKKETKKREPIKPAPLRQPKIIGFDVQEKITNKLCAFMQLPNESTSTRNNVTTYITEYIRKNNLQDMTDRKLIHLNDELAALLNMSPADHLTYFNLHKHISLLFIR